LAALTATLGDRRAGRWLFVAGLVPAQGALVPQAESLAMQTTAHPHAIGQERTAASPRTFLALLLATLLMRLPALFSHPFCIDESYYSAGAVELLAGGTFFRDVVDHKPPGIYLIYALVYRLAGAYNQVAVHALLILVCARTAFLVGLLARELFGERAGRIAGMLYAATSVIGPANDFQAANTELFVNLPIVAMLVVSAQAARRRALSPSRGLLLGFLGGTASLIRPQAVLILIPVVVMLVRNRVGWKNSLLSVAGIALPLLAVLGWLWKGGALADAAASMAYAQYYASSLPFEVKVANGTLKTLFFLAIDVGLVIPVVSLLGRARRRELHWQHGAGWLLASWAAATAVTIAMGGRFYPHYFLLALPPLAVVAACQLARWQTEGTSCVGKP
jgi:4-amino-4-deoxy-L-arabinose transferase-like glycosyltransferase